MLYRDLRGIMRRREVIFMFAGAAASYPFVVRAQQSQQMRRIGVVMLYPESDPQGQLRATAFQRQLEKAGWTIGGNLQVNFQWGTGDADWVRSATDRALRQAPDVLLANGDPAALAAYQSTKTVPIIFIGSGDPVGDGLVQSLAHPGANVTGFAVMEPSLGAKLLGMLRQIAPQVTHVANFDESRQWDTQTHTCLAGGGCSRFFRQHCVGIRARKSRNRNSHDAVGTRAGVWCDRSV